jgi:RimJ/RimL family protein N-acetyltransferase
MTFVIRALTGDDWRDWHVLRLEALQLHPEAFAASYEEEAGFGERHLRDMVEKHQTFAAYVKSAAVGICGFFREQGARREHIGHFFGMYLKKEWRGQGIGDELVKAVIDHAKTLRSQGLTQVYSSVVVENTAACKLYQKCGYRIYGTEARALKAGDRFYDEYLLVRDLTIIDTPL